jgi:hypothetical protein
LRKKPSGGLPVQRRRHSDRRGPELWVTARRLPVFTASAEAAKITTGA